MAGFAPGHRRLTSARIGDLARAAALALDNARWLERIHGLGVEQERSRLARELHDHIGQSVVYLGFEIDRLVELNHGRAVQADLIALRGDVRNLVEELRDTLVDLRSDVTETQDVDDVLRSFLERVNRRNRLAVTLTADTDTPPAAVRRTGVLAGGPGGGHERRAPRPRLATCRSCWLCNAEGALLEVIRQRRGHVGRQGGGRVELRPARHAGTSRFGRRPARDHLGPRPGHRRPNENEGGLMVRVLIADDHAMVREGLHWALEHAGYDVVGEAADGEEAVEHGRAAPSRRRPHGPLAPRPLGRGRHQAHPDASCPSTQGRGPVHVVRRDGRVLGPGRRRRRLPGEGLHHGRDRRAPSGEVVVAAPGTLVLSPSAAPVTSRQRRRGPMTRPPVAGSRPIISKREEEVLRLVATGASIPEVGRRLYISAKTVKNHLSSIYQKLDSHDRAQAVLKAVRMGLIQID